MIIIVVIGIIGIRWPRFVLKSRETGMTYRKLSKSAPIDN